MIQLDLGTLLASVGLEKRKTEGSTVKKFIGALFWSIFISFGSSTQAAPVDLDQYVSLRTDQVIPLNDFAFTGTNILVGGGVSGGYRARTYLEFDVSSLAGETIDSASLDLTYAAQNGTVQNSDFNVHQVTSDWEASTTVWSAQPTYAAGVVATVPGNDIQSSTGSTFSWDITSLVQFWVDNPTQNYGLVLEADNSYGYASFSPFLLSAEVSVVPLPAAAWLFISAIGVVGYLGKRKANA